MKKVKKVKSGGIYRNAIRFGPSAACFSLLLLACGREDGVLAPQVHPLASASALTSVLTDPVGDACCNSKHLAYRDIVKAEITKRGRSFFFSMEMAGPIPETPEFPDGGVALLTWAWSLDTNPETFPAGFPFSSGTAVASEYFPMILWDGTRFTGVLIDRIPLLTGGEAIVTPLAFSIEGAVLKTSVNAAMVGDPSAFGWLARTTDWKTPQGTDKTTPVDLVPDTHIFAPWPQ